MMTALQLYPKDFNEKIIQTNQFYWQITLKIIICNFDLILSNGDELIGKFDTLRWDFNELKIHHPVRNMH